MWNFWCFRTDVYDEIDEKMSEQLTIALFIDFELILYDAIERFERVDAMIDSKIVENQNFWLLDVAKRINDFCEINETDERIFADFSMISYVSSDVKIRKLKSLTNFRA